MDNLIRRQDAINALEKIIADHPLDGYEDACELITALKAIPSAQPDIIQCKDCKWWGYDDDDGAVRVCHAAKHGHMSSNWSIMIYRTYRGDFYCADAERRTDADKRGEQDE